MSGEPIPAIAQQAFGLALVAALKAGIPIAVCMKCRSLGTRWPRCCGAVD